MATEETHALERQQPDPFLDLIEKVAMNPEVDAEKLKVIVGLKLQLEDRTAEKAFDAAMQEAQKEVVALAWDKLNPEKGSRHVSYKKIDAMLKPIREKYGFSESFGVEPELPAPNLMMMYVDVTHKNESGSHRRRFHLPMSISGEGPKGGGVMTGAQAVGNGTSYGMRYLDKLVWKIPMLVDKEDNDGNCPSSEVSKAQAGELHKLFDKLSPELQGKALKHFSNKFERGINAIEDIPASRYNPAHDMLTGALKKEQRGATVNEEEEATLIAKMDEIGGSCKADFLKANKIGRIGDLLASQYKGALASLEAQRRK